MKKMLAAALLLCASGVSNAGLLNGIDLGPGGNVKFVTSIFFNTVEPEQGDIGTVTQGVGDVQQILDGTSGEVLWQDGENGTDLWFVFDGLVTEVIVPVFGNTQLFFNTGGGVDFYTHDTMLTLNQDFTQDEAMIRDGELFLAGLGDEVDGFTGIATSDGVFNTGSGQFEVVDGAASGRVTSGAILRSDGSNTDFTFNYSSDSLNAGGYEYAGSADIAMVATPVPAPMSASLFGIGLAGLLFRRKNLVS